MRCWCSAMKSVCYLFLQSFFFFLFHVLLLDVYRIPILRTKETDIKLMKRSHHFFPLVFWRFAFCLAVLLSRCLLAVSLSSRVELHVSATLAIDFSCTPRSSLTTPFHANVRSLSHDIYSYTHPDHPSLLVPNFFVQMVIPYTRDVADICPTASCCSLRSTATNPYDCDQSLRL